MTVVGIISEYNPLHQGHAYHIQNARETTGAEACVCVLSSNFVQRGEPAILSKWARTRMALNSGADLVLELPCAFSCASAEYFASGAVRTLESLDSVDYLCFGSEEGSLTNLEKTAQYLAFESSDFKANLKKALDDGLSFASARQYALEAIQNDPQNKQSQFLNKPNNILGIEYIKAIRRMGGSMKPITIKRLGPGYNSLDRASSFSSASAIRHYLAEAPDSLFLETDPFLQSNLPQSSLQILTEEFAHGRSPVYSEAFETILLHLLRCAPERELALLPYMEEGLQNRLKEAALQSTSLKGLVSYTVTSRYPASRIRRILCALLTGMTGEFLGTLKDNGYAQYIRVLGFNDTGRRLLAGIRKKVHLPLLSKPGNYYRLDNPLARKLFEHEIRATDIYVLGYKNPKERLGGTEYISSPLYMKPS